MAPLPPLTFAQPVEPSADCCHWIVPVCPLTLTVVVLPEHIGLVAAVAVPPTDGAFTVTALVVAVQPLVAVKVNVAVPAETPVMTPEVALMVATAVLELDQVPEPRGIAEPAGGISLYGCPLGKLAVVPHLWAR